MPDLSEPGVWPAIDVHISDVVEIPRFNLYAKVTACHAEAGLVELRWDDTTPGSHAIGISAYRPDHPIRLRAAGRGRAA